MRKRFVHAVMVVMFVISGSVSAIAATYTGTEPSNTCYTSYPETSEADRDGCKVTRGVHDHDG